MKTKLFFIILLCVAIFHCSKDSSSPTQPQSQNHTPQIINISANPPILTVSYDVATSVIKVIAVDQDGDSLTYTWTSPQGSFWDRSYYSFSKNEQGYYLRKDDPNGEYVITCWVSDGKSAVSDTVIVIKR